MLIKSHLKIPKKKGKLDIYPEIYGGSALNVRICGDPDGLRYLAQLLTNLANYDQNCDNAPDGSREHVHLHKQCQLGDYSCEVEICRADAKGTGALPDFMK